MKPDSRVSILWQHGSIKKKAHGHEANMLSVRVSLLDTLKNQSKFLGGKSRLTPLACGSLIKS